MLFFRSLPERVLSSRSITCSIIMFIHSFLYLLLVRYLFSPRVPSAWTAGAFQLQVKSITTAQAALMVQKSQFVSLQHLTFLLRKTCSITARHRFARCHYPPHLCFSLDLAFFFSSPISATRLTVAQNGLQPPPTQFTSSLSSASGWVLIHANARVAAHPLQSARYLSPSLC